MKRRAAIALTYFASLALVAGCGGGDDQSSKTSTVAEPTVPEGAVAIVEEVEEGTITVEQFEAGLVEYAENAGLEQPPEEGDSDYEAAAAAALNGALQVRWIEGEALEREIVIDEAEVDAQVEELTSTSFAGDQGQFDEFAVKLGLCDEAEVAAGVEPADCEEVRRRLRAQLIGEAVQQEELGDLTGKELETATAELQQEFLDKWRALTLCEDDLATEYCENGPEIAATESGGEPGQDGVGGLLEQIAGG